MENDHAASEVTRSALGAEAEQKGQEHLDFITAIVLIVVSIATVITSLLYWRKQNVVFYQSAGFMPTIIGGALLIMAILLLRESLREVSVKDAFARLRTSFIATVKSKRVHQSVVGLAIFAVYVFFLLGNLPFWLASFIALAAVLLYVHFDGKIRTMGMMLLTAAVSIAAIVGLFQYAFSVPMP